VFAPGNTYSKGRAKGQRNKFDQFARDCVLAHVQYKRTNSQPPPEFAGSSLWMSLEMTLKTQPHQYLRFVGSLLPKEVAFEHTVNRVAHLDETLEWIDKQLALANGSGLALTDNTKMIEHG
jgi:hypothetical protein